MNPNKPHKNLRILLTFICFWCPPSLSKSLSPSLPSTPPSRNRVSTGREPQSLFSRSAHASVPNFESELWKYLGDDVDKQDKISNFLLYPEYLHGNLPMPYLAMQIQLKSLATLRGKPDLSSRIMYVTTSINAAILDGSLGLLDEAQAHKTEAETMMAKDKFLTQDFLPSTTTIAASTIRSATARSRTPRQLVPQRKPLVSQTSRSSKSARYRTRSSPRTRSRTGLRRQKVCSLAPSLSKF